MSRIKPPALPDVASEVGVRMGIARGMVDDLMVKALMVEARWSGGYGIAPGARSPVGPGRAPVELVDLVEPIGDQVNGKPKFRQVTPLGYRTARTRLPRVLSLLPPDDERFQAAMRYAHVCEQLGAVVGTANLLEASGRGRSSDGGAVYRTALAEEARAFAACLDGMALVRGNGRGARRDISVRALVDGVVLGGQEIKAVLRAHGWSGKGLHVKTLTEALHDALSGMAEVQAPY